VITAIFIPARRSEPLRLEQLDPANIDSYQKLVGGPIEALNIERPEATLFVNEHGKLTDDQPNERATQLAWANNTDYRETDYICGDVLLVGPPDARGNETSVPQDYIGLLLTPGVFKAQVTTHDDPEQWNGNALTFDDVWQAYAWVLQLSMRWLLVKDVRVIRAE
jgi:hypothetical protein